jgi:arabinogalactan endo-1,4-beta-galactosidase
MPDVAAAVAQGPTGPGKCHDLDHFILCSTKTDFGLSPVLMTPEQRVENAVANPGFEDGDTSPWSTNGAKAAVSTVTAHSGKYSVAETGAGTVYQDINGLEPGATYTLFAWVSGTPGDRTTAQIIIYNPSDNTSASSTPVLSNPGWQLLSRSFTVGREGAIRIHLARGPGDGTVYWDDVHIERGSSRDTAALGTR